jgi:hypothetical protein|nr:MAG TPA: hypothetical protein [Caudoviricetes sp.]
MVELQGTEKQIKLANDIRQEMLGVAEFFSNFKNVTTEQLEEYGLDEFEIELKDFIINMFDDLYNTIKSEKKASWFIRNSFLLTKKIVVDEIISVFDIDFIFKMSKLNKDAIDFHDMINCFYGLLTVICESK